MTVASVQGPFEEHRRYLWGLCYRMTGSTADADDLVQDTFVRAIERPPATRDAPLRPWLVAVALNLGRDALRRRKRRAYVGPWLPSPIETGGDGADELPSHEAEGPGRISTEARYDLVESVSFAFLVALEALTPQQRAVLLLRDVLDYSVSETATALAMSEPNVKTVHHRARRALEPYDRERSTSAEALAASTRTALHRFLHALATGDAPAVEALLAEDVRSLSDGGGEFAAARRPVLGRRHVAQLFLGLVRRGGGGGGGGFRMAERSLNGLAAVVVEQHAHGKAAPRLTLQCAVDAEGRIVAVYSVSASPKMTAIRPLALP